MPKAFPHLSQIKDPQAQATLRLLWDRLHAAEDALTEAQGERAKLEVQLAEMPELKKRLIMAGGKVRG